MLFRSLLIALMPASNGPAPLTWKALAAAPTQVQWTAAGPTKMDLSYRGNANPLGLSGQITLSGRRIDMLASGPAAHVQVVYLDEGGLHPRGEDLLGVLRAQSLVIQLVRCGPVYTESINNWYKVSGPSTQPAMLRQSLRFDGPQEQDAYELRLDASLPQRDPRDRDPRDRDPGVGGCK